MTIKRLLLIVLTLIAIASSGVSLFSSLQEPQVQSRLQLYQTNIVLQAQAWQPEDSNNQNLQPIQAAITGENPLENAIQQYQEVRQSVQKNIDKAKNSPGPDSQASLPQLEKLLDELDLRLGIIQAEQGQTETARTTWSKLHNPSSTLEQTAAALSGLWSSPPRILPNTQQLIQKNLDSWFRSTSLIQLYQLQQRQQALADVEAAQQQAATKAIWKLAIIGVVPTLSAFIGVLLLITLIGQRLVKGKTALLAQNEDLPWLTPWDGEIILQVFVFGFFWAGKIATELLVPLLFLFLPIPHSSDNVRVQAFSVLVNYSLLAIGTLTVLYYSIKRFLPLPELWFRLRFQGKWFLWGLGGYCAALPIVVVVSLINQQLWQGQGGSNPLLQLALESQDGIALGIFFFTASIGAPFFEELLFRGFLLPSLTRYLPVWGAIIVSSLLFALAHLSLSEILPLTALGIVLGVVYTRSRNLLACMLLHSLWNGGTLLSLFILGTGSN
jgi:membrane protease YdiL (CAAX protease family)